MHNHLKVLILSALLAPFREVTSAEPISTPVELSMKYRPGDTYMNVRLLGALRLLKTPVNGLTASELSGLAWDEDEQLLYAVSDNGYLVHLRVAFKGDILAGAELVAAWPLLDVQGKRLSRKNSDAEGLAIRNGSNGRTGDSELLVSFEGNPRISTYRPNGEFLGDLPLPAPLQNGSDYQGKNDELEAVTLHPAIGYITAPQQPLKSSTSGMMSLYGQDGSVWTFAPIDPEHSSIVDLATAPDDSILVLERRYRNIFMPIIVAVRRVRLDPQRRPRGGEVTIEDVVRFSNTDGFLLDNFEGIARHRGNRYFVVSDDNNSALQNTVLFYFEIIGR